MKERALGISIAIFHGNITPFHFCWFGY